MRNITLVALFSLLLLNAETANAHAFLDHADPRVGNAVKTAPRVISLWFTQNLEPAFSGIEVRDSSGSRVDSGNSSVDKSDRHVLRVGVKALPAGTYKVHWRVLSVDSHTTEGNFSFRVGE
jgi:methionine-rich copper-binding protein CopC